MEEIPGGNDLLEWFGRVPNFHDAEILEIDLSGRRPSSMQLYAWNMTDEVDERSFFILDKHALVTIHLAEVTDIALSNFHQVGIVAHLQIARLPDGYRIEWEGSYGIEGATQARQLSFDLRPGKR